MYFRLWPVLGTFKKQGLGLEVRPPMSFPLPELTELTQLSSQTQEATHQLRDKTFSPEDTRFWKQQINYVVKRDGGEKEVRCNTFKKNPHSSHNTFSFAEHLFLLDENTDRPVGGCLCVGQAQHGRATQAASPTTASPQRPSRHSTFS